MKLFCSDAFCIAYGKGKQGKLLSYNHIGIVCSSGGGSAYMIKIQIESLFPQAESTNIFIFTTR